MAKQRFITEVWDYRLSKAHPILFPGFPEKVEGYTEALSKNWVVCVYDQGENNTPLELHDTGIVFTKQADDKNWQAGHDACYKFLRSVREKYSRPEIEKLKPLVVEIRRVDKIRQKATDAYNAEMIAGGAK